MITVFTPTYNRAYIIRALYESLCRQSSKDFEWIVVDDGSTDNTRELIHSFIEEGLIPIRYFYQENSGKHIAINKGVQEARGELFFIVDSDDYLADNAVEILSLYFSQIQDNSRFAGVSGVRCFFDGSRIGGEVDYDVLDCSSDEFRCAYHYVGDMAEAYKTDILRQYPFPVIEGEKFCSEGLVWTLIAQKYILRYTSEKIYFCEYRGDGLTSGRIKCRMSSPKYSKLLYITLFRLASSAKHRMRHAINYMRFSLCEEFSMGETWEKLRWFSLLFPVAALMHVRDRYVN